MEPIGIRPTNDFAFSLTFGTPQNKVALISLLNAILEFPVPIADVQIENPYNYREFLEDKLSILDIKATDGRGWIYHIEMQVLVVADLTQRLVYYACDQYADQLRSGDQYAELKPVFTICLIEGKISESKSKVHHTFSLKDLESGRALRNTIEIHTLELGWYNLSENELSCASELERWLFWLRNAHKYDSETLRRLFPQPAFIQATDTIDRIARKTEDKDMYDLREKRLRDQRWMINSSIRQGLNQGLEQGLEKGLEQGRQEGRKEGVNLGIVLGQIKSFQKLLGLIPSNDQELMAQDIAELQALASELENQVHKKFRG